MNDRAYLRAFRFGFGILPHGEFQPANEISTNDDLADSVAFLAERSERFKTISDASEKFRNSVPTANLRKALNAHAVRLNHDDIHKSIVRAILSHKMFTERLALFWSNYFSLGPSGLSLRRLAGLHVASLRPYMFARFRDLLHAGTLNPAMMEYMNLQQAIGPRSKVGKRLSKGLNENLGREVLELYTLGVDGGYDQSDVQALSRLLTGWRYHPRTGEVVFALARAEPGPKRLLGKVFGGKRPSERDLQSAYDFLASHASTARVVCAKLVLHFIGPGQEKLVDQLIEIYLKTGGELQPIYEALIEASEGVPPQQSRNDAVFLISALRALPLREGFLDLKNHIGNGPQNLQATAKAFNYMRQRLWMAPTPAGWSDQPAYWRSASVIGARLRVIPKLINFAETVAPVAWSESLLGPLLRAETKHVVNLAPSRLHGMALVLASPEFQRR